MNAYLRTLPLPGAVRPVREHGASALDHVVSGWPAPDPADMVLTRWGGPVEPDAESTLGGSWPAPDPVMRFELPAPRLIEAQTQIERRTSWTDLVEPRYAVPVPDLHSASRAAMRPLAENAIAENSATENPTVENSATETPADSAPVWPAPTLADAAPVDDEPIRRLVPTRWVVGVAAAAGVLAVGAAALVVLF